MNSDFKIEYQIPVTRTKMWGYLSILIPIVLGVFLGSVFEPKDLESNLGLGVVISVVVGSGVICFFAMLSTKKYRLTITEEFVQEKNIFKNNKYNFTDYKFYSVKRIYGSYELKLFKELDDTFCKALHFPIIAYPGFENFIDKILKEFSKQQIEIENKEIENSKKNNFGEGSSLELDLARKIFKPINILASALGVIAFVYPIYYDIIIMSLIVIPIISILLALRFRDEVKLEVFKGSKFIGIIPSVLPSCIVVGYRGYSDWKILDYSVILQYSVVSAVIISVFIFFVFKDFRRIKIWLSSMIFMVIYSYGLIAYVNCSFDTLLGNQEKVKVIDRQMSSSKSTTYYFEVSPWGGQDVKKKIIVSKRMYLKTKRNDFVIINFHKGVLSIPWYSVHLNK